MTALNGVAQCDTNSVCTKKSVLKYLYVQNEKAHYLEKDTFNLGQILSTKDKQLILKDSLITNRNEALNIANNTATLYKNQLEYTEKTLTKEVKKYQLFASIGILTTILALFL
jgi:hypothetical protein